MGKALGEILMRSELVVSKGLRLVKTVLDLVAPSMSKLFTKQNMLTRYFFMMDPAPYGIKIFTYTK